MIVVELPATETVSFPETGSGSRPAAGVSCGSSE